MRTCNNCGSVVPDTANFCRECGAQLSVQAPEPEAAFRGQESDFDFNQIFEAGDQGEQTALVDSFDENAEQEHGAAHYAYQEPQAARGYQEPQADYGYQQAQAAQGYQEPQAEYVYQQPQADYGYQQQHNEPEYQAPHVDREQQVYEGGGGARYKKPQFSQKQNYGQGPSRWDHTHEFSKTDISENKVVAMLVYLMGIPGIIIALLGATTSPYAGFHVRQGLKIEVITILLGILSMLLYPMVLPAVVMSLGIGDEFGTNATAAGLGFIGFIAVIIIGMWAVLLILKIICFFSICRGKAKEVPLIRHFGFMR